MLANQQENSSYQNKQRRDAECHRPQSATSSRGRFFTKRGGLFHRRAIPPGRRMFPSVACAVSTLAGVADHGQIRNRHSGIVEKETPRFVINRGIQLPRIDQFFGVALKPCTTPCLSVSAPTTAPSSLMPNTKVSVDLGGSIMSYAP